MRKSNPQAPVRVYTMRVETTVQVPLNDTFSVFVSQVPGAANRFQEMLRHWAQGISMMLQR